MHKRYVVHRVNQPVSIDANWDKPVWQGIEPVTLDLYMGQKPEHRPMTQAKLSWDDENLYVIFRVEDRYVRAVGTQYFDMVCRDSCVEFFFTPGADVRKGYFNLEINSIGTILVYHQLERGQNVRHLDTGDLDTIRLATSLPKGKPIDPEITTPTTWTLEYALPWRMLERYAAVTAPAPGVVWRANLYKCADETSHPHWLTWSKVALPRPDFHRPEFFGVLEFAE